MTEEQKPQQSDEQHTGPFGLPLGLKGIFSDPDIKEALNDPETKRKLEEITEDPSKLMMYGNDPKIMNIIVKLQSRLGGGGGFPFPGGPPGGGFPGGPPGGGFPGGPPGGGFPGGPPGGGFNPPSGFPKS
eukprot:TRINITY_DN483_c0_g2_i1.p1 TRINITY_DN483_c0_g2~~TRINITY_DN483_c0_g2_i1.p1  ORF type:complete len:130 (-),score=38.43 TRINITY_DN483_c0_g2_i1:45-434(-)